ncbi:MAG: class I SAM-dependent methyltransferase [Treponema sp.]|nr:class I SAM-dependent methyltransferase [Treponema sp.]
MQKTELEKYYEKFDEDHRLKTRHGQVEFFVTMKNILAAANGGFLKAQEGAFDSERSQAQEGAAPARPNVSLKILDVGAATGAYSVPLSRQGFDVTAVELVPSNLQKLRAKHEKVKCWKGDARDLHFLDGAAFDIVLLLGPLYHLHAEEDKLKALAEAARVAKKGGLIFCAYTMNEYAVTQYCFGQNKIKENFAAGQIDKSFKTVSRDGDLYSYVRLEDINALKEKSGLERVKIFSPDGPADYMRRELNAMDQETFELFKNYALEISERPELLGAGSHLVDVLRNHR